MRTKGKDFIQIGHENWFQHCTNPVATENSELILKLKTNDLQSNTQKRYGNQAQMRPAWQQFRSTHVQTSTQKIKFQARNVSSTISTLVQYTLTDKSLKSLQTTTHQPPTFFAIHTYLRERLIQSQKVYICLKSTNSKDKKRHKMQSKSTTQSNEQNQSKFMIIK